MLYLDTSALMKIVRPEPETVALRDWLAAQPDQLLATSALAEVELPRALHRIGETERLSRAVELLEDLLIIEIDTYVRRAAADLPEPLLRSLDAIHVASAHQLRPDLSAVITYDRRMAAAVDPAVTVASPGATGAGSTD
ncbi:MAG: type II toxin-antitoxin system VapC family toxin [Natronosporangium sp.]